jgi:DNA processing protein
MTAALTSVPENVLLARAYLSRVAEPAHLAVWSFVSDLGPIEAAAAIRAGDVPAPVRRATEARSAGSDPTADLDAAARHGIRLVVPESPDWPHFALGALERAGAKRVVEVANGARADDAGEPVPPLALWAMGTADLASLGTRAVGIVGARAATTYGERVAADLAFGIAQHDVGVVSGGAFGIDAAAHRGALGAGGQTVIVSAGGLDRPYPAGNTDLYHRAADAGLVLSESPPGTAPQRHRFLSRNRLIAALSTGTVVVEAGRRSGAANTAAHCAALGRPLMAVPGPVTSAMSEGCHALLRRPENPAVLVAGVRDVLETLGLLVALDHQTAARAGDAARTSPTDERRAAIDALDPVARRVFEALSPRTYASAESLAVRAALPVLEVVRAIPVLTLSGLVETEEGRYRTSHLPRR